MKCNGYIFTVCLLWCETNKQKMRIVNNNETKHIEYGQKSRTISMMMMMITVISSGGGGVVGGCHNL